MYTESFFLCFFYEFLYKNMFCVRNLYESVLKKALQSTRILYFLKCKQKNKKNVFFNSEIFIQILYIVSNGSRETQYIVFFVK